MNRTFNNTTIAVAAIPPHIWEQDEALWKRWIITVDTSFATKQTYKQIITRFYEVLNLPIQQITEQHLTDYQVYLQEIGKSERTVKSNMNVIRRYWQSVHEATASSDPTAKAGGLSLTHEGLRR